MKWVRWRRLRENEIDQESKTKGWQSSTINAELPTTNIYSTSSSTASNELAVASLTNGLSLHSFHCSYIPSAHQLTSPSLTPPSPSHFPPHLSATVSTPSKSTASPMGLLKATLPAVVPSTEGPESPRGEPKMRRTRAAMMGVEEEEEEEVVEVVAEVGASTSTSRMRWLPLSAM